MSKPPKTSSAMPAAHVSSERYVPMTFGSSTSLGRFLVPCFCSALPTLMHDAATATMNTAKTATMV